MDDKPTTFEEYIRWLKERHDFGITDITQTHYEYVAERVRQQFKKSRFWKKLGANLKEYSAEYYIDHGAYQLLSQKKLPELIIKPFQKFLHKTFRANALESNNWVKEPDSGWILPNNWYSRINDIVRTCLVVRYLDGVEFIRKKMETLWKEDNEGCFDCEFKAKEEGYYAAHIYTIEKCEVPKYVGFGTEEVNVKIEIQLTTQLKDVIVDLLHKHYEERRGKLLTASQELWQWDYASEEFATNYLGHILHYVDGMIVGIKERK